LWQVNLVQFTLNTTYNAQIGELMQSAKDHMFCSDFPDKLRAPGGTCESAGVTSAWFSDRHRSSWFLQKMTEYKTRAYKGSEDVATVGL